MAWRGHCSACPFETEAEVFFHTSTIGNFIVYQGQTEINLLQVLAHPENSEWFSIVSGIFLRSTLLLNRNTHICKSFIFISFHCPQLFHCSSCPAAVPASLMTYSHEILQHKER